MFDDDDDDAEPKAEDRLRPDAEFEELIGDNPFAKGTSRDVFDVPSMPHVVIKRARNPYPGANVTEWFVWNGVRKHDLARNFAECVKISESARYLMMVRLTPLTQVDYADIPRMPTWFNDRKANAFGKLDGVVKCMDYGLVAFDDLLNLQDLEPIALQVTAMLNRQRGIADW